MTLHVTEINWKYLGDAVPAFVTIALMPFTYSIADGLIAGVCTYITLNTTIWVIEKLSGGRIVPPNKDMKEPWTYKIPGGVLPPWVTRLAKGKKDFWKEEDRSEVLGREDVRSSDSSEHDGANKAVDTTTTAAEPVKADSEK